MFGFIKKLFSGIAAFFSGLFGGKKKSQEDASAAPKVKKGKDFFLELDEAETGKAKEAPAKKPEPAQVEGEASQPKPAAAKTAVATAESPQAEKSAPAKNGKVEPQPNPPAAAATNGKVETESEMTFAPNYLLPVTSKPRRRPGPSLDMFRDMARDVKAPGA